MTKARKQLIISQLELRGLEAPTARLIYKRKGKKNRRRKRSLLLCLKSKKKRKTSKYRPIPLEKRQLQRDHLGKRLTKKGGREKTWRASELEEGNEKDSLV